MEKRDYVDLFFVRAGEGYDIPHAHYYLVRKFLREWTASQIAKMHLSKDACHKLSGTASRISQYIKQKPEPRLTLIWDVDSDVARAAGSARVIKNVLKAQEIPYEYFDESNRMRHLHNFVEDRARHGKQFGSVIQVSMAPGIGVSLSTIFRNFDGVHHGSMPEKGYGHGWRLNGRFPQGLLSAFTHVGDTPRVIAARKGSDPEFLDMPRPPRPM